MPRRRLTRAALHMDTVVRITVATERPEAEVMPRLERSLQAFGFVERACSRFDGESELSRLSAVSGRPVPVSDLLFEALRFALEVAGATEGAFDPTVGARLEAYGFNRHYRSGALRRSGVDPDEPVSYRDVALDEAARTVLLRKPLVLDLGAVAKGLAVDLASRELSGLEGFVVDAGGDIYAGGRNERDEPWRIGIAHPLQKDATIGTLPVTDAAVCTSGSYERPSPVRPGTHHLIDARSAESPPDLLSCTVLAPFAMMADGLSTAAFLLGRTRGATFLEEAGVGALFIDSALHTHTTTQMAGRLE